MNLAPICLFVYKRKDLTEETVNALKCNIYADKSDLIIYSDASKNDNEKFKVDEVREYLKEIDGFKSVTIFERKLNLGLSKSIISGVTEVLNKYNNIIVLEDDLITSKYFLKFMNDALTKYKLEEKVLSIHGYVYPTKNNLPNNFFLRGTDCWGWATWKDRWTTFEEDGLKLLNQLIEKKLSYSFDHNGTTNNIKMLKRQIEGKVDSWAIRWHASAFLKNKLTLYPGKSLVKNIGTEGGGTHLKKTSIYDVTLTQKQIPIDDIPIEENTLAKKEIENFYSSIKPNFIKRYFKKIKYTLGY